MNVVSKVSNGSTSLPVVSERFLNGKRSDVGRLTRRFGKSGAEFFLHKPQRLFECGGDLLGVLAAGLGEVGATATTAANHRGHGLQPLTGVQAQRDGVGGQASDEVNLSFDGRDQQHGQTCRLLSTQDVGKLA